MIKKTIHLSILILAFYSCKNYQLNSDKKTKTKAPNVLIILTDQWRAQATGYAGDPNVQTPNIDQLASISVNFQNAVSGMPVCSPFRASLLTGQRPLTHGVFMNDVQLDTTAVTMAKIFSKAGYETGYIGKWHLDGHGRLQFIPPGPRRQGFEFWKANECSHNYNHSVYYENNDPTKKIWKGYDVFKQTEEAINYINNRTEASNPFLMVLSYGTPHAPYHSAPLEYRKRFDPDKMILRENVPVDLKKRVQKDLSGYYAHIAVLDDMVGKIMNHLKENGSLENTIVVFTSDHGDLLGSQGAYKKQQPYEESTRVPMLYYIPKKFAIKKGTRDALMNSEDILPTLLGFCNIPIPETVEGINYRPYLEGKENVGKATLLTCVQPFGQWNRFKHGGKEYRAIKTLQYTYAKDLKGPWLLFDNINDPFQLHNLVGNQSYKKLQENLDKQLTEILDKNGDKFQQGLRYVKKMGYPLDETETVPYTQ